MILTRYKTGSFHISLPYLFYPVLVCMFQSAISTTALPQVPVFSSSGKYFNGTIRFSGESIKVTNNPDSLVIELPTTRLTLPANRVIFNHVVLENGEAVVLVVWRRRRTVGLDYDHCLVIQKEGERVEYRICLSQRDFVFRDGRDRFVTDIRDSKEFPIVMLNVGFNERKELPTDTLYKWEKWNLFSGERIVAKEGESKKLPK